MEGNINTDQPNEEEFHQSPKRSPTKKNLVNSVSRLFGWGFGKYGQTGSLDYQYTAEPLENKYIESCQIKTASCGEFHSAYLTNDNQMFIFGKNTFGQLGQGHYEILYKPKPVKFPPKILVEQIACGGEHTLVLTSTNEFYSWGLNIFGQLGINSTENTSFPTKVEKFRSIVKNEEGINVLKEFIRKPNDNEYILEIAAGAQHSFILTSKNYLYSCGFTQNGSLGYFQGKDDPHESTVFTRIQNKYTSRNFSKIACGVNHSGCVLDSSEIIIWGKGDNFQLDGIKRIPFGNRKEPEGRDSSLTNNNNNTIGSDSPSNLIITDFQIGENFLVILTESGEVFSFGTNEYGQLGLGPQIKYAKSPDKVNLMEKIKSISVGYGYVYAISVSNKIYGWGNNKYGQLLDTYNEKIATPKEINAISELSPSLISCGAYHVILSTNNPQTSSIKQHPLFPSPLEQFESLFQYRKFLMNGQFDPVGYGEEVKLLDLLEKKQNTLEDDLRLKEKEFVRLTKSIEDKKQIEKKTNLFPQRGKRKSDKNVKVTNPLILFDEEIKFEDLQFFNNSDVGTGTFGEVKRGYWRKTLVAVKFLKKAMEAEDDNIKSFVEELNLLKRLRHPNILLYIGACTTGPSYFLVTEYCENGNLFDYLHTQVKKIILPVKDKMRIALEIAKGVTYLHSFNPPILHRDLKSLNILLDKNMTVKIADFGWARLRDSHMTKQRGTFQWMAPEVIKKNSYTEKADVFSFGIILWELWVQEPPYKNIDRIVVAKKVATDRNYRPKLNNEISDDIKNLMIACWDYDPENRPNFETVIDYLENLEREARV